MFSIKRRQYSHEGYLPLNVITDIKLNDRIVIDNYRYIINSIHKKITTGYVKLDLLNDIYSEGDLLGEAINLSVTSSRITAEEQSLQITVSSSGTTTAEILDIGSGIFTTINGFDYVTNTGTFTFNIIENATAFARTQIIRFTNETEFKDYLITQDGAIDLFNITVDTTLLTVDTTIITI